MTNNTPRFSLSRDDIKNYWFPKVILPLLVFISLIISIWSMVLSHASIDNNPLEFSYEALGTIIGIILSAVALVISLYFVILGIGANSIRREIKDDAKEAEKTVDAIRKDADNIRESIEIESKENKVIFIKTIYELYSEVIAMTQEFYNSTNGERDWQREQIIKLRLNQCRFVCDPKNLDLEDDEIIKEIIMRCIRLIPDLSTDEKDLELLRGIINQTTDFEIRELAHYAYNALMNKFYPNLSIINRPNTGS